MVGWLVGCEEASELGSGKIKEEWEEAHPGRPTHQVVAVLEHATEGLHAGGFQVLWVHALLLRLHPCLRTKRRKRKGGSVSEKGWPTLQVCGNWTTTTHFVSMCARARLQGVLLHPISHQNALVLVLVIVRERVRHGAHAQGPLPAFASLPFFFSLLRCLLQARCLGVSLTEFRVSFQGPKNISILKKKRSI